MSELTEKDGTLCAAWLEVPMAWDRLRKMGMP